MKTRVEAGTDVARIGVWDASRNESPLNKGWGADYENTLQDDAAKGHVFFIKTGGDGGGPIDIYISEEAPADVLKKNRRAKGEFLVSVPTGRLVVGGMEDYRSSKPQITDEKSVVLIPGGDYALQCYIGDLEEGDFRPPSRSELEKALGVDDYRYYRRIENSGCRGFLLLLLFPALIPFLGWKIGLAITVVVLLIYFNVRERIVLKRNGRYQRISKTVRDLWGTVRETASPTFIFILRRVEQATGIKGGSIHVEQTT